MSAVGQTRASRAVAAARSSASGDRRRRIGEPGFVPYLFILPHFLLFAVFIAYPFFLGIWISFHDYGFRGSGPFVGFDNYLDLLNPSSIYFPRFWQTVWNTVLFVLMSVPTLIGFALLLAILLNQKVRLRNAFRTIFFAPWTLSVAVVGLIWWWLFNGQAGFVTLFMRDVFGGSPGWLTSNPWAWIAILTATLWWTIGFNTIILLAGLQGISADLYEASSIDGANRWQQFRHITVPALRPVLLLVITLQVIASFQLLGQPQIMTGGSPPPADTAPVMLQIYNTAFQGRRDLSLGAAMAIIVAILMLLVSVLNFRFFRSERS